MKTYEGLFILNIAGKEDGVKEVVDKISADIVSVGGRVETVQKMEKRAFSRVADRKHNSGYYVNVIFEGPAGAPAQLQSKFALNKDIFRVCFTKYTAPKAVAA